MSKKLYNYRWCTFEWWKTNASADVHRLTSSQAATLRLRPLGIVAKHLVLSLEKVTVLDALGLKTDMSLQSSL
jgi:hypothetical protein